MRTNVESFLTSLYNFSGGFMLVRLPDGSKEYVDFREVAPKKSFKNMFNSLPLNSSRIGKNRKRISNTS